MPPRRRLFLTDRRRALLACLTAGVGALASSPALARDYYVATTGNDANAGTLEQPFATVQKGANTAVAGDTVYIRGGVYAIVGMGASATAGVLFSRSGTSNTSRIRYWAFENEVPILDFARLTISTTTYTPGVVVTGSWLHFKGLEIRNVPMNTRSNTGMGVNDAHDDIFELLNIHHNNGSGFFISRGTGGHQIINCDSHDNYDPNSSQGDGQNADGFGVHYQETGAVTSFRGCRAWWNSDDGWDYISQEVPVITESSWSMGNGYTNSGMSIPADGNGTGFKIGSSKTGIRHVVRNCVAWRNRANGFYANHSSGGNDWHNNTAYMNGTQYNMLASPPDDSSVTIILTGSLVHRMRNNIGFPNRNSNMSGVDTGFNSWDLGITPANNDFLSVTDTGFMGPRKADGSLPDVDFLKLRAGSQMIDKGTNVNLPFVGAAPDLGAYEFGAVATGGTSGTSGAGGAGGATGGAGAGGRGGTTGTGGAAGRGGTTGTGGTAATGGTGGGSGTIGTGGAIGMGGMAGAAGSVGSGGVAAGGGGTTGGSDATGGSTAGGGAAGSVGAAGQAAAGSSGSGTGGAAPEPPVAGGCSCRSAGTGTAGTSGLAWLALVAVVLRRRKNRQSKSDCPRTSRR
jgi:MYXO-CTERM domain-containing protein